MIKKTMLALACIFGFMTMAETVDVYDFKASIRMPRLYNGIRTYQTCKFEGDMKLTYDDDGNLDLVEVDMVNKKTGAIHNFVSEYCFYTLIGKPNKKYNMPRIYPTVLFAGMDTNTVGNIEHECLINTTFAATKGEVKRIKGTTIPGPCCGIFIPDCVKLYKMSGYVTGIADCYCDPTINWTHTLYGSTCGFLFQELNPTLDPRVNEFNDQRSAFAAVSGSWSAKLRTIK